MTLTDQDKRVIYNAVKTVSRVGGGSGYHSVALKVAKEWGIDSDDDANEAMQYKMLANVLRNLAEEMEEQ